jgi:short-chain 2-methylacyl-CoA dehydrogenase
MSLDTRLNDEQLQLKKTVQEFAQEVVAPVSYHHDKTKTFPYDVVKQMADMGLFGLPFPEEYGGMGGDFFALCLALEELGKVDQSVAMTLEAGCSLGAMPVYRFGTEEQKQTWLPQLTSGQALGAFGLTEPGAGSDAGGTQTRAELRDGKWVINGTKAFITNSGTDITGGTTITAVTDKRPNGRSEISTIIVPQDTPGFTRSKKYRKMGWKASAAGSRWRHSRSAWPWAPTTRPSSTLSSGTSSARRSRSSRRSSSSWPTW